MDPAEIQAKATIAAVLITSRTVDIPSIPSSGEWAHDAAQFAAAVSDRRCAERVLRIARRELESAAFLNTRADEFRGTKRSFVRGQRDTSTRLPSASLAMTRGNLLECPVRQRTRPAGNLRGDDRLRGR